MIVTVSSGLSAPNPNLPNMQAPNPVMVPSDAQPTCTVSAPAFAAWFKLGTVTLNGEVNPANSVTFPDAPNCSFYQWSQQMFLWLTSPAPAAYGGGAHIFDSPAFYDVSPPGPMGVRTFVPHVNGQIRNLALRSAKVGGNGLPVLFDKAGVLREVVPAKIAPNGRQLILNRAGAQVEIHSAKIAPNGTPVFMDKAGKVITSPRPIIPLRFLNSTTMLSRAPGRAAARVAVVAQRGPLQKFVVNHIPVFLNSSGGVVGVEQGQADFSVLEAQNGSLIYYATMVNDVYAYFLTGQKNNMIAATQFPTTQGDLTAIVGYAALHGKTFPDPTALAVEVKTAWVEMTGLPNPGNYITMTATIPKYISNSANTTWTPNGTKTVPLALVAMHVVGSTAGHPEMIWSTFEHVNNAPSGTYSYDSTSGPKTVPQNTAGAWTFCCANGAGPFNDTHMQQLPPSLNVTALSPFTITASDTIRWKAWGAAADVSPNPIDGSPAASNTEIISIDHLIDTMLNPGDTRRNYVMTGATWTIGGAAPDPNNQVGTSSLSNTTMETYQQGGDNTTLNGSSNCFSCHFTNSFPVSHIYAGLTKLFP